MLFSGERHTITPPQTECLKIEQVSPNFAPLPIARAECDTATGVADVVVDDRFSNRNVNIVASAAFQYLFFTPDEVGGAQPSLVPINIVVPTDWAGRLANGHFATGAGNATLDIFLQLRQDPDPDFNMGGKRGTVVAREALVGATHGGNNGCISVPGDPVSLTLTVVGCVAGAPQRLGGSGLVSLDSIVEVGRTYNLELVITARAKSFPTQKPARVAVRTMALPLKPGLQWSQMLVTIGTDAAALFANLQDQIDQLREDLENHTHNYLTGRGMGHNNVQAISSPAIIPGDTAQGLTENHLRSGPVPGTAER